MAYDASITVTDLSDGEYLVSFSGTALSSTPLEV